MKNATRSWILLSSLAVAGLVPRSARAGRTEQAAALFHTRCANCHVVGHGKAVGDKATPHGFTDLTMTTRDHDDAWLQRWLSAPHEIKPDTRCFTQGLDLRQIDLLVSFLRTQARPIAKHVVPPAQSQPPRPPDPPPAPPVGLVRGR